MLGRKPLKGLVLLLTGLAALSSAFAEDRRTGNMRSRDYDRGSYYGPRHQPVLPTRPFFVQPYPRRQHHRDGGHAYQHGYRHGYGEGHDDGHADRGSRSRRQHGRYHRDHADGPQDRAYGGGESDHHRPHHNQPNDYAPRPGVSRDHHN